MFSIFYNFKTIPFEKSIKKELLFKSDGIKEFNSRMEYMKQSKGIILLTGPSGVGKTTAIRAFVEELKSEFYKTAYIPLASVSISDFYYQLNRSLGGEHYRIKSVLFSSIQKLILDYATIKKQIPVIIFDEIHFLRNDNLYELQMLLNFNFDSLDPAIVILSGHSHMRERFIRPALFSINQRLRVKYEFIPLSKEETFLYIQHQLNLAGNSSKIFNDNAIDAIYNLSSGIIRVINNIATKALIQGASTRQEVITEDIIYSISSEL
ncbi:MAG: AAA family ATPase [Candidatus Eremiobacterota bacterium]